MTGNSPDRGQRINEVEKDARWVGEFASKPAKEDQSDTAQVARTLRSAMAEVLRFTRSLRRTNSQQ